MGWTAERAKATLPNAVALPARHTCVFLQEDGAWKLAHQLVSIAVPNEQRGWRRNMEPTGSLKAFIQDWIEKAHFDLSEVENHWSDQDGVLCILTAPDQWLEGRPAILDHYRAVLPGSGDYQVFVDHLEAYREGSVGWVAAQPVFALSSGGRLPVRFTAILHLEKDGWKFVQYHVSAGITEEEFVRKAQAV